jgi:hypothetical protein
VGRVKRCPLAVAVGTASCLDPVWGGDERVVHRRVVSLIFAGWLPQDGLFGLSGVRGLGASVAGCAALLRAGGAGCS